MRAPGWRAFWIGLGLLFAMGCRSEPVDGQARCPRRAQRFDVEYAGGAVGSGHVTLVPNGHQQVDVALHMIVGPPSADVVLHLSGRGTCEGGIIRARFGGGYPDKSPIRVLGATLEGLYATELTNTKFFGSWMAQVVMRETGKRETFHGYLREVSK